MTGPFRLLAALLMAAPPATAGEPGSAFGEALRLTNTAWAMGMSGAMAASGSGVSAIALNPAGVLDSGLTSLHVTHAIWVERTAEDYFAYSMRLPLDSALGVGIHGVYDSSVARTVEDGSGNYAGEAGRFPYGFVVGGAAWAMDLARFAGPLEFLRPTGGASLRAVWQQVDRASWIGATVDAGFKVRPLPGVTLAGVLQNAGAVRGPAALPLQWVTGVAWQHEHLASRGDRMLVEVDAPVARDRRLAVRAGGEYQVRAGAVTMAVRGGWKQEVEVPGAPGVSAGLGFRWKAGRLPWGMDYAFIPWGVFGSVHALSLTLGILPAPVPEAPRIETPERREPPTVFYPLKGEVMRYVFTVAEPAELSAVLLEEGGSPIATLMDKRIVPPGETVIEWNGLLPNGQWGVFDMTYRILIQLGGQTWYKDVVPKRE